MASVRDLVERLTAVSGELNAVIAARIAAEVPGFPENECARSTLPGFVHQISVEMLRALRGEPWSTAPARNIALVDAELSRLPVEALVRTFRVAEEVVSARLRELDPSGIEADSLVARLSGAIGIAIDAMLDSYLEATGE